MLGEASESDRLSHHELHEKITTVRELPQDLHAADIADDILEALPYDERLASMAFG